MHFLFAVLAVILTACNDHHTIVPANRYQAEGFAVDLQRGPQNQASIRVRRAPSAQAADEALMEMQGYAQALDKFVSMDIVRRSTSGRLAELYGESALPRDRDAVGVGLRLAAERTLARLDRDFPEERRLLEAYTMGVNRALQVIPFARAEYLVFYRRLTNDWSYVPERWQPIDSIYAILGVSYRLSGALKEKLTLGAIAAQFYHPEARRPDFDRLFDWRPLYDEFITSPVAGPMAPVRGARRDARPFLPLDVGCENTGFPFSNCLRETGYGSNNWVVNRAFSGTVPMLANDPHLMLSFPMSMYEMKLDSKSAGGTFRARGFNLPGIPGILIGHNDRIAWGFTNLAADVDDVFIERLRTRNGNTYVRFNGRDVRVEQSTVTLKYRRPDGTLSDDTTQTTMRLVPHHGPIFSDWKRGDARFQAGMAALQFSLGGDPVALSYRWTGHGERRDGVWNGTGEVPAILGVNRASSFAEFKWALRTFEAGAQNMVYLDIDGNIGYYAPAKYPIRPANPAWPPFIPQDGTGDAEWLGYREQIPELYNPASGRIVTANNDPIASSRLPAFNGYRNYMGFGFSTGSRARRIVQLLDGGRGRLDLEAMKRIQTDHVDLTAQAFTTLLRNGGGALAARAALPEASQQLLDRLRDFDGAMNREASLPVSVDAWLTELGERVWAANRGRGYVLPDGITGMNILVKTAYHRIREGIAAGDGATGDILRASLEGALRRMQAAGRGPAVLWGDVHRLTFGNLLPGLMEDFQPAPMARDGYLDTVDPAGPGLGPVFRLLITVENDAFRAVTSVPGGNYGPRQESGWLPELTAWRDGVYRPFVE